MIQLERKDRIQFRSAAMPKELMPGITVDVVVAEITHNGTKYHLLEYTKDDRTEMLVMDMATGEIDVMRKYK